MENKSQMFCPQCGGKVELDSPDVKFCRFCGLTLGESRDAVKGYTEIKRQGMKLSSWGYVLLQIMFIIVYLTLIPSLPLWGSIVLLIFFALSNGFFIAGSFAVEDPGKYQKKGKTIDAPERKAKSELNRAPNSSIAEGTTRKLSKPAFSEIKPKTPIEHRN